MSLKAFHIFFILCSILLAGFFAFWQYENYAAAQAQTSLIAAAASAAVAVSLVFYLFWFLKKLKKGNAA